MSGSRARRAAGVVAAVTAAIVGGVPLLAPSGTSPLEGILALAASVTLLCALLVAPLLLAPGIALYGAEIVVAVHAGDLALSAIPLLAAGLLLVHETADARHRLPAGAVVEAEPLRALVRRLVATGALGLVAAVAVVAASSLSTRGGAAAAVVGGLAAAGALLVVRALVLSAPAGDGARER